MVSFTQFEKFEAKTIESCISVVADLERKIAEKN